MQLVKIVLLSVYLAITEANYIRINNTGTQNLVLILEAIGHPPSNGTLIEAGNYTEIITLNEWVGSFWTYPEECLTKTCDYPVTRVMVEFERYLELFGGFYDFLMVDLNQGFNVPASIKSLTRSDCKVISCETNLLELCPEVNQIKNDNDELVACQTSELNYQDFQTNCPDARVDATDIEIGVCASMNYEITFG